MKGEGLIVWCAELARQSLTRVCVKGVELYGG